MSESHNQQDGIPSPSGNQNTSENLAFPSGTNPIYFDPSQNPHGYQSGISIARDSDRGKTPYAYPTYAPGRNYGAVSRREANTTATIALILGVISFFTFGPFLSVPGYVMAKQAEVVNGEKAKIAKILNLVSIVITGFVLFFFVFIVMIAGVSHLQ